MFMIGYTINYEWFFSVCLGRRLRLANLIHVNNGKEIQRKFFFNKEGTFSVNTCVLKINFHVILKLLLVMTNNLSYCYNKSFSKYKLSVHNNPLSLYFHWIIWVMLLKVYFIKIWNRLNCYWMGGDAALKPQLMTFPDSHQNFCIGKLS